jgi:dienelactone hydrolase
VHQVGKGSILERAKPLTAPSTSFPVIIYSHGYYPAGFRVENTAAATELASHGYIVVAIDHIDCSATIFPNQQMVTGAMVTPGCLSCCGNPGPYLQSRLQDVQFLLGDLARLNQTDPVLAQRLDLDDVGMMGWKLGGGTAAESCRRFSQIRAAALLNGRLDPAPDLLAQGLQKPFLAINSPYYSMSLVTQNTKLFNLSTNAAYLVHLMLPSDYGEMDGCGGPDFTDLAWITEHAPISRRAGQTIGACLVAFFDKHLKNLDNHLLDSPTNTFSNIVSFQKKP